MWKGETLTVIMPAYNEGDNIYNAVCEFSSDIVDEILVVDNNSIDNTAKEAARGGAHVVLEQNQGYGNAIRRGIREATGDLILIVEPDGTFIGKDIVKLLAYADDFDCVFGTRTSKELIWEGANMGRFLKWGNWTVAKLMEILFNGPSLTDVGCTMRLVRQKSLKPLLDRFKFGGSHFSPEMMLMIIQSRVKCVEVPVNYRNRVGTSKITGETIKAFTLGCRMIALILRRWMAYRILKRPV